MGYLIPAFIHLKRSGNNSKMGPTALVLSPTRELATQIQDEAVKFGKSSRISCAVSNCSHFHQIIFLLGFHASAWVPLKFFDELTNLRLLNEYCL